MGNILVGERLDVPVMRTDAPASVPKFMSFQEFGTVVVPFGSSPKIALEKFRAEYSEHFHQFDESLTSENFPPVEALVPGRRFKVFAYQHCGLSSMETTTAERMNFLKQVRQDGCDNAVDLGLYGLLRFWLHHRNFVYAGFSYSSFDQMNRLQTKVSEHQNKVPTLSVALRNKFNLSVRDASTKWNGRSVFLAFFPTS